MTPRRSLLPFVLGLAALTLCAVALSACGDSGANETSVVEGESVELGSLRFNTVFTRQLNPHDVEDMEYLVGQPPLGPDEIYLGVFVQVKNIGDSKAALPTTFTVEDTEHRSFDSLPSTSPYAFPLGAEMTPDTVVPDPDSTPGSGPIQGSLVLFKLPYSVTENRPLTMSIPGEGGPAEVELDI
jgi:hypothetical protein